MGHNKQTAPEIRRGKKWRARPFGRREPEKEKESLWNTAVQKRTHTHADKHKCVPFLFARSSFRGLSKNMASEEDAFERQETQIRLRAPGFPVSKTWWHWLGWASRPPTPPPPSRGHKENLPDTLHTIPAREELGTLVDYLERVPGFPRPFLSLLFPYCKSSQHAEIIACNMVTGCSLHFL